MMRNLLYWVIGSLLLVACQKEPIIEQPRSPVVNDNQSIKKTVLVEPIVSVNCGICPLAHHDLERIEDSTENVVHMSHYLFGPLHHAYSQYLMDRIDKTIYTPLGIIDRRKEDGSVVYYQREGWGSLIHTEITEGTEVDIALTTDISESEWTLDVEVEDINGFDVDELLLTLIVVEKSVVGMGTGYDQRNYGHDDPDHPYYGQGDYIEGFEHTNVIRDVITSFDGDKFPVDEKKGIVQYTYDASILTKSSQHYAIITFVSLPGEGINTVLNTVYHSLD